MIDTPNIQPYVTMDGLGNDFIVFDARVSALELTAEQVRHIANRETGLGCDQVLIIRPSEKADVFLEIWNANGQRVSACGNGSRCIAWYVVDGIAERTITIETDAGVLNAHIKANHMVTLDMGAPKLGWRDIPLAFEKDTITVPLTLETLSNPGVVSMGNPHAVFFVADVDVIDLETLGRSLEHHPLFPEGANISICSVADTTIRQRVWERGVGITKACGTAACAALVAAHRKALIGRSATILQDGGALEILWNEANHVIMTGAVSLNDRGTVTL